MRKLFVGLCLFYAISIYGQQAEIEQLLSASFASSLTASKTHQQVAWVHYDQGARNIHLISKAETNPNAVTQFEGDDGQAIGNIIFHPDGNSLFFVRGGAPNRAGEIPNPQSLSEATEREIWRTDLSGQAVQLFAGYAPAISSDGTKLAFVRKGHVWLKELGSEDDPIQMFQIRGSASGLQWSPTDPDLLAFSSSRGDHGYVGIFRTGSDRIKYLAPTVDHDSDPSWSPDGAYLAFIRRANQKQVLPFTARRSGLPWSIWVHSLGTDMTEQVWQAEPGIGSVFRNISADNQLNWMGDRIVFPYEGEGWTHLYSVSTSGDLVHHTPGNFEVQYVCASADQTAMYFSSSQDDIDRQHIWTISTDQLVAEQVTSGQGLEFAPVVNGGGQLYYLASDHAHTPHPQRFNFTKNEHVGFGTEAALTNQEIIPQQVIFPSEDGLTIHGQLFLPSDYSDAEDYPAVMFFHGGSRRQMLLGHHHRQYYSNAFALNQYLAEQGFIVLSVNYRSGIGYGMEFREALEYGAQGGSEYLDVLAGATYLKSRGDVDGAKIGLWGGSYGGYLTALGLARNSDLFAAGVDIHGVHDWNVVIRNFVPAYQAEKRQKFAETAFRASPMADIATWRSPVLVIHGDDDRNVPFSETVDLVEALRGLDVHVEQLVFPDEVHGFLLHGNWVAAYAATVDFLERMLRD